MSRKIVIAVVGAIAVGAFIWQQQRAQPTAVSPVTRVQLPLPVPALHTVQRNDSAPMPVESEDETAHIPIPGMLDGSDEMTRAAAHELSPTLLKWLIPEQQIRKWVVLVDAAADGKLPTKDLPLLFPMPAFDVISVDDTTRMNPQNFTRANLLIDTVTAIDVQKLANYYHAWRPVLEIAYKELGREGSFKMRLQLALQNVLDAPVLPENTALVQPKVYYIYADPALEKSSGLNKLLWRLGTANQRQLQSYLGGLLPLL